LGEKGKRQGLKSETRFLPYNTRFADLRKDIETFYAKTGMRTTYSNINKSGMISKADGRGGKKSRAWGDKPHKKGETRLKKRDH